MADPYVDWDNSVAGLYTGTLRGHTIRIQRVHGEPKPYHVYVNDVLQGSKHTIREAQNWAIRITHRQEFKTADTKSKDQDKQDTKTQDDDIGIPHGADNLSGTTAGVLPPSQQATQEDMTAIIRAGTEHLKKHLTEAWEKDPSARRDVWACVRNGTMLLVSRRHGHTDWECYTEHAYLGTASTKHAAEKRCLNAVGWEEPKAPEPAPAPAPSIEPHPITKTTSETKKMDTKTYQRIHPKTDYASFEALLGKACAVLDAEPSEVVEMIGYAAPDTVLRNWAAERKVPVTTYWAMIGLLGEGQAPEVDHTAVRETKPTKEYLQVPVPVFTREQLPDIIQVFSGDDNTDDDLVIAAAKGLTLARNAKHLGG